jgi:hypothetical protein
MKKYRVFLHPYSEGSLTKCVVCSTTLKMECYIIAYLVIKDEFGSAEEWITVCSEECANMWILQNM